MRPIPYYAEEPIYSDHSLVRGELYAQLVVCSVNFG